MGKFKMPTVSKFLSKKTISMGPKLEPVWVYLEKEMLQNIDKKPYNDKVGQWLKFLRELKHYYHCEAKRKERRLKIEVGPPWYCELSSEQREVLSHLKENIHQDLLEDLPNRMKQSLLVLGITLKIPKELLMQAMKECVLDPGIFIWKLYTYIYKSPPSELKQYYDINAMILMSCLVFIDLEECIERLEKLTYTKRAPKPEIPKKKNKYSEPKGRYGVYLQKMYVPCYLTHSDGERKKFEPIDYKFRVRSQDSYERLCMDSSFIEKRLERNKKAKQVERVCTYKFWEPPSTLRNTDPKLVEYVNKLKMFKQKAKAKHKKIQSDNTQMQIAGVSFTGEKPHYILANVAILPTGYIPINGGICNLNGAAITIINGYWKFPREVIEKCDSTCDCLEKWEKSVMEYIKKSKCKCGHLYDFYNEGKTKEKFFNPPTRHGPLWFDHAKIYQMDPVEDFIKDTVREALMSAPPTPTSTGSLSLSALKDKEILAALLADLSDSPLLIPHLPKANLLNNLQEWVRKNVRGPIQPKQQKKLTLQSQRRWLDLKHMDFKALSYKIPFTLKELKHFDWSHRHMIQHLFEVMLDDFVTRNQRRQLMQTRLLWSTMKYDPYPSKAFLDIYFTYMPGRMKDTFIINPYNAGLIPKFGAKTCPLGL